MTAESLRPPVSPARELRLAYIYQFSKRFPWLSTLFQYCRQTSSGRGANKLADPQRSQNSQVGITGALLYVRGNFIQVLEGSKQLVEALYVNKSGFISILSI
ncbi:BLUF domain-containing protein [Spirosoma jeollabukense]